MRTAELGSLNGSIRRQKPRLTSGLAKCSTHDSSGTDLVGQRIKVWWPLDKAFYEGVVQSYDSAKKTHRVLYDDGDIEQLKLAKEKWKIIETNDSSVKQGKKDHPGARRAHVMRTTSSTQAPPNQRMPKKRPSPPKMKGKPKGLPKNKRRKTIGGEAAIDDSNSSSSVAHSDSDKDIKSDGHKEKAVGVSSAEKELEKECKEDVELKEEKSDGNSLSCKEESDDETLNVWRKRTSKAT